MPIRCVVLDDEQIAIDFLLRLIDKVPFLDVVGSFTDPRQALTFVETNPVDLIFLDIEMPNYGINGLDFINLVGTRQNYIFTTANPQYAVNSYDYNAVDFLTKPISFERFSKAVHKARKLLGGQAEDGAEVSYTYVRIDGTYHRLDFDEVCWIESERNYVSIYTEQDRLTLRLSISEIEDQLPKKHFVRVHKSYIVAKKKIALIETYQLLVEWQGQSRALPLGESYRKNVADAIAQNSIRKK